MVTRSSSVSVPFRFLRTRHGGVGQRSGTGLETPLLGWALPLTILNHVSLGVDVPVFFPPGDVASSSYFFSFFQYTLNGYLMHNSITNLLVIKKRNKFSATEIFNTSTRYTGSTKTKVNPKKKEFTYSIKWRCFLPIFHLATRHPTIILEETHWRY